MTDAERHYLELLKRRIAERYFGDRSYKPVEEWSVPDIEGFREDLQEKVQGSVSEKWIYTHLKGKEREKLPRIDTLNLLSRYAGYAEWEELKAENPYETRTKGKKKKKGRVAIITGTLLLILLAAGLSIFPFMKEGKEAYRICFEDADTGSRISAEKLSVKLIRKEESPIELQGDSSNCFELPMNTGKARFVVKAPYYRTDTIVRKLSDKGSGERIPLEKDDQALLIHSFSKPGREDFEERRSHLDSMIAENARIYQIHGRMKKGIEIYNKEEFIDKLTMPLSSLKRIEVIETRYTENGKMRTIRFEQGSESHE